MDANISVLNARPGDILILRYHGIMSQASATQMRARLDEILGPDHGLRILILDQGAELSVIRRAA